jgi:hypothetical protein
MVVAGAAILLSGCDGRDHVFPIVPPDPVDVAMQAVSSDIAAYLYSGMKDRHRLAVPDSQAWTALWRQVTQNILPPVPVPAIDFNTDAVIIASMGMRPTGGYSIEIESVQAAEGTLYVTVLERSPGTNCVVTQAVTAPVHAVRVPRQSFLASVVFTEKTEVQNCG